MLLVGSFLEEQLSPLLNPGVYLCPSVLFALFEQLGGDREEPSLGRPSLLTLLDLQLEPIHHLHG